MCVLLITRLLRLVGRLGTRKPVQLHQLNDGCDSTDRYKSVLNRRVIEVFGGVYVLSIGDEFSVGIEAFVIGLSQISFFFSLF